MISIVAISSEIACWIFYIFAGIKLIHNAGLILIHFFMREGIRIVRAGDLGNIPGSWYSETKQLLHSLLIFIVPFSYPFLFPFWLSELSAQAVSNWSITLLRNHSTSWLFPSKSSFTNVPISSSNKFMWFCMFRYTSGPNYAEHFQF